jgi:hypothetical protein
MAVRDVLWDPRKGPLAFITFGYLMSVSTNLVTAAVPTKSGFWWVLVLGVPALVIGLILSPWFAKIMRTQDREPVSTLVRRPKESPILVGLASKGIGISSMKSAILYHHPKWVFLVHSEDSKVYAEQLRDGFVNPVDKQSEINPENFRLLPIDNVGFGDPERIRELIENEVYRNLPKGKNEGDVMIDITGGTKGATAGAFLAGLADARKLEIVVPKSKDKDGRALEADDPVEIDISYKLKKLEKL